MNYILQTLSFKQQYTKEIMNAYYSSIRRGWVKIQWVGSKCYHSKWIIYSLVMTNKGEGEGEARVLGRVRHIQRVSSRLNC